MAESSKTQKTASKLSWRWSSTFYLLVLLILVLTISLWPSVALAAGWWWDIAGGIGFAAFVLFLLLNLTTGFGVRVTSHKLLGWWALGFVLCHAAIYLAIDPIVIEHLKISAPYGMIIAIAALVAMVVGIIVSLPRFKMPVHGSRTNFRRYHRFMSWLVLAGSLYHIFAVSHSIHQLWQVVGICGGVLILIYYAPKIALRLHAEVSLDVVIVLAVLAGLTFAGLRNV